MNERMKGVLSLTIKDITELKKSYMPFIEYGGLFVPTDKFYNISDTILLRVSLLEDIDIFSVLTNVVWITPNSCHGSTPGIGLGFTENNTELKNKIELHLLNAKKIECLSYTM